MNTAQYFSLNGSLRNQILKRAVFIFTALSMAFLTWAQVKAVSEISLALKKKDIIYNSVISEATFSLNGSTQEFNAVIDLFPIVPNPDMEDSLAVKEKPLRLHITGRFPVRNVSFLTVNDNNKTYSMECQCSLYDSSKSCPLNFNLIILQDRPPVQDITGAPFYQPRLSFAVIILPSDYGLDKNPFDIIQPVMIMVKGAQINKLQ